MFAKKLIHNCERKLWISLRYAICETLRNVDFTMLLAIWKVRSHGFMQSVKVERFQHK